MAKKQDFTGELLHFGAVRMRINGSGTLRSTLYSLDDLVSSSLSNITMAVTTSQEPTILANFIQQRAHLRVQTTAIDEYFVISKMIVYVTPVATSLPQ